MLLLGFMETINAISHGTGPFLLAAPQYWIFPLQTLVCGAVLIHYWGIYALHRPRQIAFTVFIAIAVLVLWIAPQLLLGLSHRDRGFDPGIFDYSPPLKIASIALRFLRLVVVVPLLEEIFWRGFLLRYLISENFTEVPFGKFTWFSFTIVVIAFAFAHAGADFWPALITGALYNLLAAKTRSLASCVLAHALTNLGLGIYIMQTRQWGFW